MYITVVRTADGHRLSGGPVDELANHYLALLGARGFSPGTVRGYAFDLLNFGRFLAERSVGPRDIGISDLFEYLDWQGKVVTGTGGRSYGSRRVGERQRQP
jgi:integrase/recombinase XerC